MKVDLTYFKKNGKFYTNESYETYNDNIYDIWDEVTRKIDSNNLPGITRNNFIVLVSVPDLRNNTLKLLNLDILLDSVNVEGNAFGNITIGNGNIIS